jgi:hypothetical protein
MNRAVVIAAGALSSLSLGAATASAATVTVQPGSADSTNGACAGAA